MAVEGMVLGENILGLKLLVYYLCCIKIASLTINCLIFSVVISCGWP